MVMEVAVAVICRGGDVLLSQRQSNKKHAGLWEFPGGKFEPGESFEEALKRELREELGIEVTQFNALMDIFHTYPEYSVHLRIAMVTEYLGQASGLEFQKIEWVPVRELSKLPLLDANLPIVEKLTEIQIC